MDAKLDSIDQNHTWDLVELLEDPKKSVLNGSLRQNTTLKAISKDISLDL